MQVTIPLYQIMKQINKNSYQEDLDKCRPLLLKDYLNYIKVSRLDTGKGHKYLNKEN